MQHTLQYRSSMRSCHPGRLDVRRLAQRQAQKCRDNSVPFWWSCRSARLHRVPERCQSLFSRLHWLTITISPYSGVEKFSAERKHGTQMLQNCAPIAPSPVHRTLSDSFYYTFNQPRSLTQSRDVSHASLEAFREVEFGIIVYLAMEACSPTILSTLHKCRLGASAYGCCGRSL